jgi:hypothetical protein
MKDKLTATLFVLINLLIALVHGKLHSQLHIDPSTWQEIFIALVIVISPILAMSLLWMRLQKVGLVLLLASMAGSLFFGLANHSGNLWCVGNEMTEAETPMRQHKDAFKRVRF